MDDPVTNNMGKESVSIKTSDLTPVKPKKLLFKLKISKNLKSCGQQHICPACSKGFNSGKALGGHIRIHMKGHTNGHHRKISKHQPRNIIYRASKSKKRISKMAALPKVTDGGDDRALNDQESNEKVSCCVCNKNFKSMKSLFGHMRNHPERNWRGIRPPVSDKNSCCSSVSENDEALEVDQISSSTQKVSISDLLKSLPTWTNTAKRCEKLTSSDHDNEIPEAAYCLLKLARGNSVDLDQSSGRCRTKNPLTNMLMIDKSRSSVGKGKAKLKTESDQDDDDEEQKMKAIIEKNDWFDQFEKFPMKPDEEEEVNPSTTMEGRHRGNKMFPSSQTLGCNPKNPSGRQFEEVPLNETAASPLIMKTATQAAAEGSQVCSSKTLDFDLNEPYVPLEGEDTGT